MQLSSSPSSLVHMNSFMYNFENGGSKKSYVSPKEYQKRSLPYNNCNNNNTTLSSRKIHKKSKKIILGKPIVDGKKQKMSLQELKALSRQIPMKEKKQEDILMMSRNLRENLFKAKSKMMHSLKNSTKPKDVEIYENLFKDEAEIQLKLVTSTSSNSSDTSCSSSNSSVSSLDNQSLMFGDDIPLYTPSIMNMELFFQNSNHFWTPKTMPANNNDVTEDQIDSWLQRGGFGDHMSPMIMATDQELADLLDFDM